MSVNDLGREVTQLERALLRKAVVAREADLHRCADCARTPLLGERVAVYEGGRILCSLCRPRRREEPLREETVLGAEHGHAVRLTARAAA